MKAWQVAALVAAAAVASFAAGSLTGMAGMFITMMTANVLMFTAPAAAAALAVLALVFWLGAKTAGAKPRWDIYGKVSLVVMGLTVAGSLLFVIKIMQGPW